MAEDNNPLRPINEGWLKKGWTPKGLPGQKVQGGYVPTAAFGTLTPPTGGSGVMAVPKESE